MMKLHYRRPVMGLALFVVGLLPLAGVAAAYSYSSSSQESSSQRAAELTKQRKLREQFEKKRDALRPAVSKSNVNSGKVQNFPIQTGDAPDQSNTSN